jgi:hypothetical protein
MSSPISYKKGIEKGLLKEVDFKRFAVVALLYPNIKVNYPLAAYEAGTTIKSFPVLYKGLLKKLRDAGCEFTEEELGGAPMKGAISYSKVEEKMPLKEVDLKRLAIVCLLHNYEVPIDKVCLLSCTLILNS